MKKVSSAKEAVSIIEPGQRVFIHGQAATPNLLLRALFERGDTLHDVELVHLHIMGDIPYEEEKFKKSFRVANFFVGSNVRGVLDYDHIDYLPCFLSEIPSLIRSKKRPVDVALIHLSSPDEHGHCSLGVSVDIARAAVERAKVIIAQINPQMPRVHGDGFVHISQIDYAIDVDMPLHCINAGPLSEIEKKIGKFVANLVENGSTVQAGIGAVPDAALLALKDHKHLGIHSEMWSDGALELIESGVVDNTLKVVHPGKTVSSFIMGTQRVYDYIHDNPAVIQLDIGYVNSPFIIARNPKVVAVNSAVEIDLTGQICADSVGSRIVSGVGGQLDFMRGATLSRGGKPILALTSRTKKGIPRIVPRLREGAGVVTSRPQAHYVVTEYGVVDLFGKTLRERAKALTALAHPDDREDLEKKWHEIVSQAKK